MSLDIQLRLDEGDVAKLRNVRINIAELLLGIVTDARNLVRRKIMTEKLMGQVLRRRTGTLLRSIQEGGGPAELVSETHARASLGTNVWYGKMWETTGYPAHEVQAAPGKALRFQVGGQVLFRKRVRIPAQAPRPFIRPALEESREAIRNLARVRVQDALKRAAGGA